jgi:hypothetical protein
MVQARALIAAGADLLVGSGPHVVQPPELCEVNGSAEAGVGSCAVEDDGEPRTAAVLYSLGNAATTMGTLPCQVGLLATVSLGDAGVTGLGWDPLVRRSSSVSARTWARGGGDHERALRLHAERGPERDRRAPLPGHTRDVGAFGRHLLARPAHRLR